MSRLSWPFGVLGVAIAVDGVRGRGVADEEWAGVVPAPVLW